MPPGDEEFMRSENIVRYRFFAGGRPRNFTIRRALVAGAAACTRAQYHVAARMDVGRSVPQV